MKLTGPYNLIVADTKAQAEMWARKDYGQKNPKAVWKGSGSRDGRKTFKVYDLADGRVVQS